MIKQILVIACSLFFLSLNAQNTVQLKAIQLSSTGVPSTVTFQHDIENNSKLSVSKNGIKQPGSFDLELQEIDRDKSGGIGIIYKILNEEVPFDKYLILDMRKLSIADRKAASNVEYPVLIIMRDEDAKAVSYTHLTLPTTPYV